MSDCPPLPVHTEQALHAGVNHPQHRPAVTPGSVQDALLSDTADTTDISFMLNAEFSPAPACFPSLFLPLWGSCCLHDALPGTRGSCQAPAAPGRDHPCAWAWANIPSNLSSQPACRGMLCLWGCSGVQSNALLVNNTGLFITRSYGVANNSHIHHTVFIEI